MPQDLSGEDLPYQRIRELFQKALDRGSEEREAFLDQVTTPRPTWTRYEDRGEIARGGMGAIHCEETANPQAFVVAPSPQSITNPHPTPSRSDGTVHPPATAPNPHP